MPEPRETPVSVALDLAYFAGWIEHASINAEKKRRLAALLLIAARHLTEGRA